MRWFNNYIALALALILTSASAQTLGPPGGGGSSIPTPVSTTNGGTGVAGTLTGARKANGASPDTQAATTDLSDTTTDTVWTPTDGSGAGLTFTSITARYTKIGKQVTAVFRLTFPTTVNASIASISGLPVSVSANYAVTLAGGSCWSTTATLGIFIPTISAASPTSATFLNSTGAGSVTNANLSTLVLSCVLTYIST